MVGCLVVEEREEEEEDGWRKRCKEDGLSPPQISRLAGRNGYSTLRSAQSSMPLSHAFTSTFSETFNGVWLEERWGMTIA